MGRKTKMSYITEYTKHDDFKLSTFKHAITSKWTTLLAIFGLLSVCYNYVTRLPLTAKQFVSRVTPVDF